MNLSNSQEKETDSRQLNLPNVSKSQSFDNQMKAPTPVRSHPDMVELVTEQLRKDPFPVLRQPSPKFPSSAVVGGAAEESFSGKKKVNSPPLPPIIHQPAGKIHPSRRSSPENESSVSSSIRSASVTPLKSSMRKDSSTSDSIVSEGEVNEYSALSHQHEEGYTYGVAADPTQQSYQLAELAGNAFLGDRISFHGSLVASMSGGDFPRTDSYSPVNTGRLNSLNMQRAYSFEGLHEPISLVPCMIRMPRSKEYHRLGDSLETIPKHSWLIPYMIAACPPLILCHLMKLPLLFDDQWLNPSAVSKTLNEAELPHVTSKEIPTPYAMATVQKSTGPVEGQSLLTMDRIKSHNDISGSHFLYGFGRPHHLFKFPLNDAYIHQQQQQQQQQSSSLFYDSSSSSTISRKQEMPRDNTSGNDSSLSSKACGTGDQGNSINFPSFDGKARNQIKQRSHSPGLLVSALNFPKSWHSVGTVWLSKDPAWSPWEAKIVLLLDNYLLECTADGSSIIGYAQLCGANVVKTTYSSSAVARFRHAYNRMNKHEGDSSGTCSGVSMIDAAADENISSRDSNKVIMPRVRSSSGGRPLPPLPSINEAQAVETAPLTVQAAAVDSMQEFFDSDAPTIDTPPRIESPRRTRDRNGAESPKVHPSPGGELCSSALLITCYTTSALQSCPTKTFWLTVNNEEVLDGIASVLTRACKLTVNDIFHFPSRREAGENGGDDIDSGLLGRGQYNEVRVAVRKDQREIFDDFKFNKMMRRGDQSAVPVAADAVSLQKGNTVNADTRDLDECGSEDSDQNPAIASFRSVASVDCVVEADTSAAIDISSADYSPLRQKIESTQKDVISQKYVDREDGDESNAADIGLDISRMSTSSVDPFPSLQPEDNSKHSGGDNSAHSVDRDSLQVSKSDHGDPLHHNLFTSVRVGSIPLKDSVEREKQAVLSDEQDPSAVSAATVQSGSILDQPNFNQKTNETKEERSFDADSFENRCALKLVSKEIFWNRVGEGKERTDSLVREALAQLLLCCHFAGNYVLTFTNEDVYSYGKGTNDNDSTIKVEHSTRRDPYLPIVQLFSVFETVNGLALELELMQSMDLFDRLAEEGPFSELQVKQIVYQLVEAISLCNRLGIAHRDMKLSNITFPFPPPDAAELPKKLIDQDFITVKLADFGMTGFVGADRMLRGRCGTPGYVAPDILLAERNQSYDLNVDMFSIGVVAYTLLCGYEPFYGEDSTELLRANKEVDYTFHSPEWDEFSSDAKDFIAQALQPHASIRFHPEEAKKHRWLQGALPNRSEMSSGGGGTDAAKEGRKETYENMIWSPEISASRRCTIS